MTPDKDLIEMLGNEDATKPLIVGKDVYDPLVFQPNLIRFTRKQYVFLHTYRLGVPFEEACLKSDMSPDQAERFLKKPSTVAWLEDRAMKDYIRNEWAEGGKWWQMGDECLEGKRHLSKDQQVVFMAFGERVCPKPRLTDETNNAKTVINFNFSAESVKEAFKRQEAIDAEMA